MYLSQDIITLAVEKIRTIHPFIGIDFLASKQAELPVGAVIDISMDAVVREFMDEFYKPFEESDFYFAAFNPRSDKNWWDKKYPGSTSQSRRTRGRWSQAYIHDTAKSRRHLWGWQENYLNILVDELKGDKVYAFYLAVWLFRDHKWNSEAQLKDIIKRFVDEFNITEQENEQIFDISIPNEVQDKILFQQQPFDIKQLIPSIGLPEDLPQEGSGILAYISLNEVGPADFLELEPGQRINVITGDNGLGKTFLLDVSWWALTGHWISYEADPSNKEPKNAQITYRIAGEYTESDTIVVNYDRKSFSWPLPEERQAIPSILVYARADNSFAIWDPAQHYQRLQAGTIARPYQFSPEDVWMGLEDEQRNSLCEGLLRDWVRWQETSAIEFETLKKVLIHLSPQDTGELRPGKPTRVPGDRRPIPTLALPYGDVAIIYASEGMKRIISLAYLLVWTWSEHKTSALQSGSEPQRRMVILIDEIEAHLHPKWQRYIMPALVDVQAELSTELEVQFLVATHSPLVMTSVEPIFDPDTDKLFNLELSQHDMFSKEVVLKELPFVKFGPVNSWLDSDAFEYTQARSPQAEAAIKDAKDIQLEDNPHSEQVQEIHSRLVQYLSADDEFWPRWLFFAENNGVEV